jgi:hypothetical protein
MYISYGVTLRNAIFKYQVIKITIIDKEAGKILITKCWNTAHRRTHHMLVFCLNFSLYISSVCENRFLCVVNKHLTQWKKVRTEGSACVCMA